jgi:hypothetical protein
MISKDKFLSDFKNTLEQVESLLQEGAQIDGRYRGQWKVDKWAHYHTAKGIGHARQALEQVPSKRDGDSKRSHFINAIARLMIANEMEFLNEVSE